MNKYKCKICGKLFPEEVILVNSSKLGVIFQCPNCSYIVWGYVSKR